VFEKFSWNGVDRLKLLIGAMETASFIENN